MSKATLKWIAGGTIFFLPTVVVLLAKSSGSTDIRLPFWGSLILAAIVPPILVLRSKMKGKVLYAPGLGVLLGAQFCVTLLILLAGFRS